MTYQLSYCILPRSLSCTFCIYPLDSVDPDKHCVLQLTQYGSFDPLTRCTCRTTTLTPFLLPNRLISLVKPSAINSAIATLRCVPAVQQTATLVPCPPCFTKHVSSSTA